MRVANPLRFLTSIGLGSTALATAASTRSSALEFGVSFVSAVIGLSLWCAVQLVRTYLIIPRERVLGLLWELVPPSEHQAVSESLNNITEVQLDEAAIVVGVLSMSAILFHRFWASNTVHQDI